MTEYRALYLTIVVSGLISGCQPKAETPPESAAPKRQGAVERLSLISTPSGARARLSSGEACTTPCAVQKRGYATFSVTFEKENYTSQTVRVTNNLEVMRAYNARRGMQIDVDELNRVGKIKLVPNPVSVELEPEWSK